MVNHAGVTSTHSLLCSCCVSVDQRVDGWMNGEVKCDLIQILLSLCHMQTGKHQRTEENKTNSVGKHVSCIHYTINLSCSASSRALTTHLEPDKLLKHITSIALAS